MQSLGIYGDSFADSNTCSTDKLASAAWCNLLKTYYNVTNYALGGSSLYYSYRIFLNTHHLHDKCLFLSTDWSREHNNVVDVGNKKIGFNSLHTIYFHFKNYPELFKNTAIKNKIFALEQYYLYLFDAQTNYDLSTLMIEKIRRLRPDVFLMDVNVCTKGNVTDCFDVLNMFQDYRQLLLGLNNIKIENSLSKYNWIPYPEKNTVCHFPVEINEILAQNIKMFLKTRIWPPVPKNITFKHPADYYWDLSKNDEINKNL